MHFTGFCRDGRDLALLPGSLARQGGSDYAAVAFISACTILHHLLWVAGTTVCTTTPGDYYLFVETGTPRCSLAGLQLLGSSDRRLSKMLGLRAAFHHCIPQGFCVWFFSNHHRVQIHKWHRIVYSINIIRDLAGRFIGVFLDYE